MRSTPESVAGLTVSLGSASAGGVARLLVVATAVAAVTAGLVQTGLPSPALFAGMVVGLLHALATRRDLRPPSLCVTAAQGVIGVVMGVLVQPSTLPAVAGDWPAVLLVTVVALGMSLLAGVLLARWTGVDRTTAALGMISGGAIGITALSDDLGADARLVAVLQYVRVLLIVALMPVAVVVLFGRHGGPPAPIPPSGASWPLVLAGVAGLVTAGTWLGQRVRLPAPSLLGPLLLTAPLAAAGAPFAQTVPGPVQASAFALLGASVGLRFTPDTLRTLRRILPVVLALLLALIAVHGALGLVLSAMTGVAPLDGYLATTPGGVYVALAVAADSSTDTTVVLAVQVLRMLVMLLAAPSLARLLLRRR